MLDTDNTLNDSGSLEALQIAMQHVSPSMPLTDTQRAEDARLAGEELARRQAAMNKTPAYGLNFPM